MIAVETCRVALQFAGVLLRTFRTEHRVAGNRQGLGADQGTGRIGGRGRIDIDAVVGDRILDVLRQVGVVGPAQVKGRGAPDRVGFAATVGTVVQIDVEEGRLTAHEGFLGHIFGRGVEIDFVGDAEVGADLIALRFRSRNAAEACNLAQRHAVAADVVGTVEADIADALAEVGVATDIAVIDEGLARHDAEAVGGIGEATARQTVFVRNVRVGQIRRALQVGQGGLAPRNNVQTVDAVEDLGVENAIIGRGGRIGVDAQANRRTANPVDVCGIDIVDLFVLGVGIDVQTVVEEVLADQARDTTGGFAIVVDLAVVGVDFDTLEVFLQDEVQHARNSVCTVNRRRAAGDDLDVLDQQARDGVNVNRQFTARGADVATAVNKGQGAVGTQRAKVRQRQTAGVQRRAGGVGRDLRVRQGRNGGEVVDQAGLAGRQDFFLGDLNERRRGIGRAAADTRTGDDNLAQIGGLFRAEILSGRFLSDNTGGGECAGKDCGESL